MRKIIFFVWAYLAMSGPSMAQLVKLFYENKPQGYVLYSTNPELYPVSVSLSFELENMFFSEAERKVFIIPAKQERFKIGELSAEKPNAKYKFSYKYVATMGDVTITDYDDYDYDLPFQKGKSYNVYQGYHGSFSHQDENAIDFTMPEGSEILAAREGLVVQVVQNNTESCPSEACKKYNNYITVMHNDGSFSNYGHIQYNGARCKAGDMIRKGDIIAYSGNVGYSSGPHLHFVCFLGAFGKWNTLETRFKVDDGDRSVFLQEKTVYRRNY